MVRSLKRLATGAVFGAALLAVSGIVALTQTSPGLRQDQTPTAAQWNSYFAAKQDYLGFTPINPSTVVGTAPIEAGFGGGILTISCPTCAASATFPLTSAHILVGNGSNIATDRALSGDATISNTGVMTLASVVSAGGPTGSATVAPIITYDAKGRLTTVTSATITPAVGSITGFGTGVGAALAINVGSAGAPVLFNGAGGTPLSIVLDNATYATDTQVWSATAGKPVDAAKLNSAGAIVGLTDAATIATNMQAGINFSVTLGGNRTLGAPTNTQAGRSGCYFFTQDGSPPRTLAYNAVWKFPSAVAPVLSTTAGAVDMLCYVVKDSTNIMATIALDMR